MYDVPESAADPNGHSSRSFKLFSNAHDFVIETDNFSNAIVIDDSTQKIGIGTSKPTVALQVVGDISASGTISASVVYAQTFASSSVGGDVIEDVDKDKEEGDEERHPTRERARPWVEKYGHNS